MAFQGNGRAQKFQNIEQIAAAADGQSAAVRLSRKPGVDNRANSIYNIYIVVNRW